MPIVLILLAGCIGSEPAIQACVVIVPPARLGDEYEYRAEGTLAMLYTTGGTIIDWRAVHPEWQGAQTDNGSMMTLEPGSSLRVNVADKPILRLDAGGNARPAYQVSYTAQHPRHPRPFHFVDEWIDAATGDLLQSGLRATLEFGNETKHLLRMTRIARPPLFFATWLGERPMTEGDTGAIGSPREIISNASFHSTNGWAEAEYVVQEARPVGGSCVASVEVRIRDLVGTKAEHEWSVWLQFSNTHPVPVEIREKHPAGFAIEDSRLELKSVRVESGPAVPPWTARPFPESNLMLGPPDEGFLKEDARPFPTTFEQAMAAARADGAAGSWLRAHPEASPARVIHRNGQGWPGPLDEWQIAWAKPGEPALVAEITTIRRPLPSAPLVSNETREVRTSFRDDVQSGGVAAQRVTMRALADLSTMMYGEPMEVLVCHFNRNECFVGSHASTGWPYAGTPGGAFPQPGVQVLADRGVVFLEQSLSASALDDPQS